VLNNSVNHVIKKPFVDKNENRELVQTMVSNYGCVFLYYMFFVTMFLCGIIFDDVVFTHKYVCKLCVSCGLFIFFICLCIFFLTKVYDFI
jgi:hypothetical protein